MIIMYSLLIFVCFLLTAFTSYEIKYLSLADEDFIHNLKIERNKINKNLSNEDLYNLKLMCLELFNLFTLTLGIVIVIALVFESTLEDKHLFIVIFEIIYASLLVLFSYFLPRALARRNKTFEDVHLNRKYIILIYPLYLLSKIISKPFIKQSLKEEKIDEDVLNEMVDSFEEEGVLEEDEAEMVRGAIDLHNIEAHEIMTPRVDVFAIDVEESVVDILKKPDLFTHSRIPVYEETIDHIVGVLTLKALYRSLLKGEETNIRDLCYKPLFVSSNLIVTDLLNEFRESKTHIAVVIDEYGGTKGIVTMEDILEEIVGDIFDETDEIEEEVYEKGEGIYIVDGSMNIDDFFNEIEYKEEYEGDFLTVSGFIQELLGRFPKKGDTLNFNNYTFKVLSVDGFVVDKLEVKTNKEEE